MAKKFDFRSHLPLKNKSGQPIGYEVRPYARMSQAGEPTIIAMGGNFYGSGGNALKPEEVPQWVKDRIASKKEPVRAALGFGDDPPPDPAPEKPKPAPRKFSSSNVKPSEDGDGDTEE